MFLINDFDKVILEQLELGSDPPNWLDVVHFLWKVGDWFAKWEGEGTLFARQRLFFFLDSQVIQILRIKKFLIILTAVTYVIHGRMCFRAVGDQPENYWLAIFLETIVG